jgi:hypothetical protein
MLKLSFYHAGAATPAVTLELTDLRATGAVLWNPLDRGSDRGLIATYANGLWKYGTRHYPRIAVMGGGCLLFGISRAPTLVSDPIDHYYFIGPTLSANGVAIAKYMEKQDMWQGIVRPMWWNAMRILSADTLSAAVDGSQSRVVVLNPWDPQPMHSAPHVLDEAARHRQDTSPRLSAVAAAVRGVAIAAALEPQPLHQL